MDELVSALISSTCQMFPKANADVFRIMRVATFPKVHYSFVCGSTAEFYIQPPHPCIDDTDLLNVKSSNLAFTDEKPILPSDVRDLTDTVDCFLMEPYHDYPSFIRLRSLGQMQYNWSSKIFDFLPVNVRELFVTPDFEESESLIFKTGPAIKFKGYTSLDIVESIWCPQWPLEAKNWPSRRRKYGWPATANIREIVHNGCHVVYAKHRACRSDVHQCRLSFSVAEVILLQSWTPVQQIVYHMLRFLAKKELIKKDCPKEDEVLCTYHFKTLMLWFCEEKSPEWWNSMSLIGICCLLLQELATLLLKKTSRNYFIPTANLFHEHMNQRIVDETAFKLIGFCYSNILSVWFMQHYIQPLSSDAYELLDISEALIFLNDHKFNIRKHIESIKRGPIDGYFSQTLFRGTEMFRKLVRTGQYGDLPPGKFELKIFISAFCKMGNAIPSTIVEPCFEFFASVLNILHTSHLMDCTKIQIDHKWLYKLVKQVSIEPKLVSSRHHNFPIVWKTVLNRSQSCFIAATGLMENLTGSYDDPEFRIVSEISYEVLREAMLCEGSKTKAIIIATLTYMAALYFAASEYEAAIDLCSAVLVSFSQPTRDDKETLNAGCLFYINDIVGIIGFHLLFRHVKGNFQYSRKQLLLDLRLTPEVFAQYLIISSVERTHRHIRLNSVLTTAAYPLDVILMTIINQKYPGISRMAGNVTCVYQRTKSTEAYNKMFLHIERSLPNRDSPIQLLVELSLGIMKSFYEIICKYFSINYNTVDCYRASYLYRCRKYPQVLHLCEQILDEPDLQSELREYTFANAMVIPPFDSYFDSDVQCLLGFHTLFCYLSPLNEDLQKFDETPGFQPTFEDVFARKIFFEKCFLSIVLFKPYSVKCHYFLGRHFLARYLKVRYLIDCNHSLSEVLFEFKKLKASLSFEKLIRCFLEQKLRQLQKVVDAKYCSG